MVTLRVQSLSKSSNWSLSRSHAIRDGQSSSRAPRLRTTVMPVTLRRGCDRFRGAGDAATRDAAIKAVPRPSCGGGHGVRRTLTSRAAAASATRGASRNLGGQEGRRPSAGRRRQGARWRGPRAGLEAVSPWKPSVEWSVAHRSGRHPSVPACPRIGRIVWTVRVSGGSGTVREIGRYRRGGPLAISAPRAGGGRHPGRRLPVRPAVHHG